MQATHSQLYFSGFCFSPSSRIIKVGGALLAIKAGPTQDAWQVTVSSNLADFNFHTTITCLLHALLFVDDVIILLMNYVHIHYFAVTKLAIIELLSMY